MKIKMITTLLLTAMFSFIFAGLIDITSASAATGNEVKLLHAQYKSGALKGSVNIENIAYDKQVNVVWRITGRTDGWISTPATYAAPKEGNFEAWEFVAGPYSHYSIKVAQSAAVYGVEFFLEYFVNGKRYVDDNNGVNYQIGGYSLPEAILNEPAVKMSEVAFGTNNNFTGNVYLKNLTPNKEVKIVYSTDNWATVQVAWAHYAYSLDRTNNYLERWDFDAPVASDVKRVEIAVMYIANGTQYWDTNYHNRNYIIQR